MDLQLIDNHTRLWFGLEVIQDNLESEFLANAYLQDAFLVDNRLGSIFGLGMVVLPIFVPVGLCVYDGIWTIDLEVLPKANAKNEDNFGDFD